MTKPANFPGRKNDRRKGALARMKKPPKDQSRAEYAESEHGILSSRILPDAVARGTHTKKDRSARGKLRV